MKTKKKNKKITRIKNPFKKRFVLHVLVVFFNVSKN